MRLLDALLDLLFPPKCPCCGRVLDHRGICPACQKKLRPTGEGRDLRRLEDGLPCAAPLWYTGVVRQGVLRFKFHGDSPAAEIFADLMAPCLTNRFGDQFQLVTWAPVSRRRLRRRGYDQAELLARALGRRWGKPAVRLLVKIRDNPAQSGLPGKLRRENVRGVYRVHNREILQGKRILLIDDVCTTGSTLSECAQTLLAAGARSVVCGALAHRAQGEEDGGREAPPVPSP